MGAGHVHAQEVLARLGVGCRSPRWAWAWVDHGMVVLLGKSKC